MMRIKLSFLTIRLNSMFVVSQTTHDQKHALMGMLLCKMNAATTPTKESISSKMVTSSLKLMFNINKSKVQMSNFFFIIIIMGYT